MAFWLHRIEEKEPDRRPRRPQPGMEALRRALHRRIERLLVPVAVALHQGGVGADHVSVAGLVVNVAAAALIVAGHPMAAGALYLFAGLMDLLDGVLARSCSEPTRFGAFLDSTLDRASEGIVFAAIGYRFAADGLTVEAGVVVLALLGSFLVSYTRARAEALGAVCRVGIATRAERIVLVGLGLLTGLLAESIHVVTGLTAITVVQRIVCARRELRTER